MALKTVVGFVQSREDNKRLYEVNLSRRVAEICERSK